MKTSAVDCGRRLNGKKPAHASAPASAKASAKWLGWIGDGVDCEEGEGDAGHRCREPVHVVEQVEGVRDADQPDDRDRVADKPVAHQLHVGSGPEHDRRSADLCGELRKGRQAEEVVCEPGREDEGDAGVDPDERLVGVERADGDGGPEARR